MVRNIIGVHCHKTLEFQEVGSWPNRRITSQCLEAFFDIFHSFLLSLRGT